MVEFEFANNEGTGFPADDEGAVNDAPVAVVSPLISLRERREQIVNDLYIDIKVPRWDDPSIFVRFRPVSAMKLNAAIERRRKQKGEDWTLLANADVLIDSCIGIYAIFDGEDHKYSLRHNDAQGKWTKFDKDLADSLGVEAERATDTLRALYLTEGDLIDTANKLFRWSNISGDEADETF
jgi:hypothetical protein